MFLFLQNVLRVVYSVADLFKNPSTYLIGRCKIVAHSDFPSVLTDFSRMNTLSSVSRNSLKMLARPSKIRLNCHLEVKHEKAVYVGAKGQTY